MYGVPDAVTCTLSTWVLSDPEADRSVTFPVRFSCRVTLQCVPNPESRVLLLQSSVSTTTWVGKAITSLMLDLHQIATTYSSRTLIFAGPTQNKETGRMSSVRRLSALSFETSTVSRRLPVRGQFGIAWSLLAGVGIQVNQ